MSSESQSAGLSTFVNSRCTHIRACGCLPLRPVARAHRLKKRAIAEQQKHSQQGDALAAAATARAELQRYIEAHKPEQEQLREALTLAREQEHAHKATATAARAELESIRSERLEALAAAKSAQSASQHEAEVARSETSAARAEARFERWAELVVATLESSTPVELTAWCRLEPRERAILVTVEINRWLRWRWEHLIGF